MVVFVMQPAVSIAILAIGRAGGVISVAAAASLVLSHLLIVCHRCHMATVVEKGDDSDVALVAIVSAVMVMVSVGKKR